MREHKRIMRMAWFAGLWLLGVLSMGLLTGLIRLAMQAMR